MKKLLALLIALSLCLSLCLALTSCNDSKDETNNKEEGNNNENETPTVVRTTATEEEWNSALNISNFSDFSLTCLETETFISKENELVTEQDDKQVYKMDGNYIVTEEIGEDGIVKETSMCAVASEEKAEYVEDMLSEFLDAAIFENTYSLFTYDENSKSYISETFRFNPYEDDEEGLTGQTTVISFSDGKLTGVSLSYDYEDDYTWSLVVEITYGIELQNEISSFRAKYNDDFINVVVAGASSINGDFITGETLEEKTANVKSFLSKLSDFALVRFNYGNDDYSGRNNCFMRVSFKNVSFEFNGSTFSADEVSIKPSDLSPVNLTVVADDNLLFSMVLPNNGN